MLFWYSKGSFILLLSYLSCHKVENSCHSSIASTLSCLLWGACWDLAEPLDTSPGREGPFTAPFLFPTPGKPSQGQAGSTLSMPPKPSEPILIKPACDDYWGREWKTDWEHSRPQSTKRPQTGTLSSKYTSSISTWSFFRPFVLSSGAFDRHPKNPIDHSSTDKLLYFRNFFSFWGATPSIRLLMDRIQILLLFACCWL